MIVGQVVENVPSTKKAPAHYVDNKKFFEALNNQDYNEAANQMLDSNWHKQTPKRCEELSNTIRSCV